MAQCGNFNKMLISSVFGVFLCLFVGSAFGQAKKLSREQMVQDIDTLFSFIDKVHPDMYAVYPKQQLDKDIEKVKSELEPSGDIFYFYKQITPLVAQLGDGHTNVNFPYDALSDCANILFFPFFVKVTYPDKVILVQNNYKNTIPIGAQIMSINNRQANDIVQEMLSYARGEKDFYKIWNLRYAFTPMLYTLYRDSIFEIEYLFNKEKYSIQVRGISLKECEELWEQDNAIMSSEKYTFNTLSDKNIGIIEFNEFQDMEKFNMFLDSTFQVLQKENIGNLIIDIRENGGGSSLLGDKLFQYISPVPFRQFGKTIIKYSDIQKQIYKTRHNWDITNPNGIEIINQDGELIALEENNLRYKGNVFLLISHTTFSSATNFSWAFKYFKMGTVVGEETGGMAVHFGETVAPTLPNSGFLIGISSSKFYCYGATDENIHGTLPDYVVEAEKALNFTIDLITREK